MGTTKTQSDRRDATRRFSNRVRNYVAYRPRYPKALFAFLESELVKPPAVVADVGCGTGILAEPLLQRGYSVLAVEPNDEMRTAAVHALGGSPGFSSFPGTAEATGLPDSSVALIAVGQAFHWFDPKKSRAEFLRVLKPSGWVALIWNVRQLDTTPLMRAYETFVKRWGTDYEKVRMHGKEEADNQLFFGAGSYRRTSFPNSQRLDFEGLKGRLLSCSYIPSEEHPSYEPMLVAMRTLFEAHAQKGLIHLEYDCDCIYGSLR